MRNLKKFLALVLAMMMAFSLMVTVNAKDVTTDFSDSESVTESFQEGLQVLAGMKVFEGYEDGTFKPKNNITRAEVATIVYRIATGDAEGTQEHLYVSGADKFVDVADDHWAAGAIGYCANNLLVLGYDNVHFGPNNNVTGVQALAMILRAVGYGKNGEFQGNGWETRVYGRAQNEGLLYNVNNTTYASRLTQVAPRELVAELLFQAAQIPQVTWTMLGDYSKTSNALGTGDTNPSLGAQNYGLTYGYGIIVGNQETGASSTQWGTTRGSNGEYIIGSLPNYTPAANRVVSLKMDTGLKDFGHNYKVWYNYQDSGAKTVYAAYDKVVKTKLVSTVGDDGISLDAAAYADGDAGTIKGGSLYKVVTYNNEFVTDGQAHFSSAFKGFTAKRSSFSNGANLAQNAAAGGVESTKNLYVVVSNSSNNKVDAVISLNIQTTKISQVENVAAVKSITANYDSAATAAAGHGWGNPHEAIGPNFEGDGNNVAVVTDATADDSPITIKQSYLTANSSKTLNDYVVINAIGLMENSTRAMQVSGYNVAKIVDTKVGQVSYFDTKSQSATFSNYDGYTAAAWEPDYVILTDGTKIEKSLLYFTVPEWEDANGNYHTAIPQTQTGFRSDGTTPADGIRDEYLSGTYKFYLDSEGKYIGAERVYGEKFIYGTYVDYGTEVSTGAFNYYITGVTLDGEIVTEQFTHYNSAKFTGDMMGMDVYYHDANNPNTGVGGSSGLSGVGGSRYRGFVINDQKNLTDGAHTNLGAATQTSPADLGVIYSPLDNDCTTNLNELVQWWSTAADYGSDGVTTGNAITSRDVTVGAKKAYNNGTEDVYLTNNTKFIVVSGHGTSNVKAEVYNGLKEFLGDSHQVFISTAGTASPAATGGVWLNQFAYTKSNYFYADDGRYAQQIDTLIIPKGAVERIGGTEAYFLDSNDAVLKDRNNTNYNKYTLYLNGEKQEVWLNAPDNTLTEEVFGRITATGGVTSTGETVYTWTPLTTLPPYGIVNGTNTGTASRVNYQAATRDATVALIGGTTYNVANAKVVNLLGSGYPNLKTVADLNDLSTTAGAGNSVKVFAVQTERDSHIIGVIYVVAVAST